MTGAQLESPAAAQAQRVPAWALVRVFLRSFWLQASWNRRGMQNLGFAWALWPALCALYPDKATRSKAAARHLSFFNSHPYLAAAILGGAIHHEEKVAAGEEAPEAVERFKHALMFPFAAVGDSFFWLSLRPFAGAFAALMAPWIGVWAVVVFLAFYNVPHLALRITLFVDGYKRGDRVVENVARAALPKQGARLRRATAVAGGAALVAGAFLATLEVAEVGLATPRLVLFAVFAAVGTFASASAITLRRGALSAAAAALFFGLLLALVSAIG